MSQNEPASLVERAGDFSVASLLASYPDDEVEGTLRALAGSLVSHAAAAGLVGAVTREGGIDDLRSSYLDCFERGPGRVSLHETEYGRMRGMSKGNDLADISGFYRAFGLDIGAGDEGDGAREMRDHLAVELEFYATLLAKQDHLERAGDLEGPAIIEDARRKFLEAHLGPLAGALAGRAAQTDLGAYAAVLTFCAELARRECASLGVEPTPLDFFSAPDGEGAGEMKCGAVHLPVIS